MKPRSIQLFDRLYLGAVALGLINTMVFWSQTVEIYAAQGAPLGSGILVGGTAFGVFISLLLWFFISSRASKIAKWILVGLFGIGLVSLIVGVAGGNTVFGLQLLLGLAAMLIQAASVWMLFRPDAVAWFSGRGYDADIFR